MRGKFLNQKCIFNFFPQAYLLVLSERIVLHPKTFTLDIRQGYLSTITISCFLSSTIPIQQLDYPISATVSQFSNRPSISSCIKTRIKNTLRLGGKIINYIYYIKNDHEKKTKKILRFPCFLASYCLSLDDKVNTIRYQQFTLLTIYIINKVCINYPL